MGLKPVSIVPENQSIDINIDQLCADATPVIYLFQVDILELCGYKNCSHPIFTSIKTTLW